jgi:hypothetical protein
VWRDARSFFEGTRGAASFDNSIAKRPISVGAQQNQNRFGRFPGWHPMSRTLSASTNPPQTMDLLTVVKIVLFIGIVFPIVGVASACWAEGMGKY